MARCAAREVAPAGCHAWMCAPPGGRSRADAERAGQPAAVHRAHRGRDGAPRIQRELLARGKAHSRKRRARLMRERGLNSHRPRRHGPRTTGSNHDVADRAQPGRRPALAHGPRPGVGQRPALRAHRARLALCRRRARALEPPGHRRGLRRRPRRARPRPRRATPWPCATAARRAACSTTATAASPRRAPNTAPGPLPQASSRA